MVHTELTTHCRDRAKMPCGIIRQSSYRHCGRANQLFTYRPAGDRRERACRSVSMRIDTLRLMTSARLVVVATDAMLHTAAFALSTPHVGLIVVCDQNGRAAGVVSKSDLVRHLTSMGTAEARISTLMS